MSEHTPQSQQPQPAAEPRQGLAYWLGNLVMKSPVTATAVTAVAALLSLLLPPLLVVSGGSLALVALRSGVSAVVPVFIAAVVAVSLLGIVVAGNPALGLVAALTLWLPTLLSARALKRSGNLAQAIVVAVAMGLAVAGMLLWHSANFDWEASLTAALEPLLAAGMTEQVAIIERSLAVLAPLMPGLIAASLLFAVLLALLLGRGLQAAVYNPGGFALEFRQLRFGPVYALVFAVTLGLAFAGLVWAQNLLMPLALPALLQGLGWAHFSLAKRQLSRAWLVGFYVLLVLLPQVVVLVTFIGWLDNLVNIRGRGDQLTASSKE